MRRRRYNKGREAAAAEAEEKKVEADEEKDEPSDNADNNNDEAAVVVEVADAAEDDCQPPQEDEAAAGAETKSPSPEPVLCEEGDDEPADEPVGSIPPSPSSEGMPSDADDADDDPSDDPTDPADPASPKRSYMGVARMRRLRLKEQKARRLASIADAEVLNGPNGTPGRSGDGSLERELRAEVAAMGVTASMVRDGSAPGGNLVGSKGGRRAWWSALIPPAGLVPRILTLALLFLAGLDLGTQPRRLASSSAFSRSMEETAAPTAAPSAVPGGLIHHVETSVTKPWEYGGLGRAAYLVGATKSRPPTALPTPFYGEDGDGDEGEIKGDGGYYGSCIPGAGGYDAPACAARLSGSGDVAAADGGGGGYEGDYKGDGGKDGRRKKWKDKKLRKLKKANTAGDEGHRVPRGVAQDASEFDDLVDDAVASDGGGGNVDPVFGVDLDLLLLDAALPFPVDAAARFAIRLHRTWVRVLWTVPSNALRAAASVPAGLLRGWADSPPWILLVCLAIRLATRLFLGPDRSKDDPKKDGGGGGKDLDVLSRVKEYATNYATGTFPRTFLVLGTVVGVMKVDMYVVLCGLLTGLACHDVGGGGAGAGRVLGEGEL